jgi:hypothetical protein
MCFAALLALCAFGFGQDMAPSPTLPPALPAEVLGPQLIAWSQLQKPQPVSQPLPPSEQADQQQSSAFSSSSLLPSSSSSGAFSFVQMFTGTIMKDSGKYVLKAVDGAAYQLDNQATAKLYEGKQVKVSGRLDRAENVVHMSSIEAIS